MTQGFWFQAPQISETLNDGAYEMGKWLGKCFWNFLPMTQFYMSLTLHRKISDQSICNKLLSHLSAKALPTYLGYCSKVTIHMLLIIPHLSGLCHTFFTSNMSLFLTVWFLVLLEMMWYLHVLELKLPGWTRRSAEVNSQIYRIFIFGEIVAWRGRQLIIMNFSIFLQIYLIAPFLWNNK